MTEEVLLWAQELFQTLSRVEPVTKKSFIEIVRGFASDMQAMRPSAEAGTEKLVEQEPKVGELTLKIQLLAEKTESTGDLQKRLNDNIRKL